MVGNVIQVKNGIMINVDVGVKEIIYVILLNVVANIVNT